MAHIDEQRIMELALGMERSTHEAEHLAACAQCRAALSAEAEFSEVLANVARPAVPDFLAARIEVEFEARIAARGSRAAWLALAVTACLLAPLTALLMARWTELLGSVWSAAVVARVLTGLVFAHGSTPVLVAVQSAMLLGGLTVLMRLLRTTALAPGVMR